MWTPSRRELLRSGAALAAGLPLAGWLARPLGAQAPAGVRPAQDDSVRVLLPRDRVPLAFIIDDSTCLVNMGRYCMPQFAEAWPGRAEYDKPWQTWPHEIPDAFVREFGQWSAEHGVKGKFSVVPCPALVGWLDRELPGWPRSALRESLKLVRELMLPHWDIHPEMITHTRVIDIRTGRPFDEISAATMENSYPQEKQSVDELAAYLAYALRILKNCDLPCEGITTPGGFGNAVKAELSLAVFQAVRDVFGAELPHYFKYVSGDRESTEPKLEYVDGLDSDQPRAVVNVPAGTGDWFGGWDGDDPPQGDRYANEDATAGRMVELIERGEPAIMLCHWPGMYTHGTAHGFAAFKRIVLALNGRFADRTAWMKLSEIARYWAARQLTQVQRQGNEIALRAPYATSDFTLRVACRPAGPPAVRREGQSQPLEKVADRRRLAAGSWCEDGDAVLLCFDLAQGATTVTLPGGGATVPDAAESDPGG